MTATIDDTEDQQDTPELAAFRRTCREFFAANAKKRVQRTPADGDDDADEWAQMEGAANIEAAKRYQSALYDAGLAGITWPKDAGGQGLSNEHQRVFNEEAGDYELPTGV